MLVRKEHREEFASPQSYRGRYHCVTNWPGHHPAIHGKDDKMPDAKSKVRWEAENVLKIGLKINRNQDPELYELLSKAPSRSGLARDLMNQAIREHPQK